MRITFKSIINKKIIVGITYVNEENKKIQFQIHGRIISADKNTCIIVCVENIDLIRDVVLDTTIELYEGNLILPSDLSAISCAQEGDYHLKYTNEVIVNPDLLSSWTVTCHEK